MMIKTQVCLRKSSNVDLQLLYYIEKNVSGVSPHVTLTQPPCDCHTDRLSAMFTNMGQDKLGNIFFFFALIT